jgi:hypothetical protein
MSSLCQDIDDKLLVLWLPSSHLYIRMNGQFDIVLDVFQLSVLIV